MAHEITHTLQGGSDNARVDSGVPAETIIRRWAIGGAVPVPVPDPDMSLVPQDHTAKLNAAEAIVRGVLASQRCIDYFSANCGLGEADSALQNAFDRAQIYFLDRDDNSLGLSIGITPNIAYNRRAFRIGRYMMASTLVHEMFHTCDPNFGPQDEIEAETAVESCRVHTPLISRLSTNSGSVGDVVTISGFSFGASQGSADQVLFNGVSATVTSWGYSGAAGSSLGQIVCRVPAGATTGDLVVVNNNVRSNTRSFTVN